MRPCLEPLARRDHGVPFVRPRDTQIGDPPRREVVQVDPKAVGVLPRGESLEAMAVFELRHEARAPRVGMRGDVERPRGHAIQRLERA